MTQPASPATWRLIPTVIEHLRKNPKDADAWEIKELCERAQAATVAPLTVPDEEVIQSILSVVAYDMHDAVEKDLRALLARKSIPSAIGTTNESRLAHALRAFIEASERDEPKYGDCIELAKWTLKETGRE